MKREKDLHKRIEALRLKERQWRTLDARLNRGLSLKEISRDVLGGVTRGRASQIISGATRRVGKGFRVVEPVLDALEPQISAVAPQEEEKGELAELSWSVGRILVEAGWSGVGRNDVDRLVTAVRAIGYGGQKPSLGRWPRTVAFIVGAGRPPPARAGRRPAARPEASRARRMSYKELAKAVLEEADRPLHWREMAERAEGLGGREEFSPTSFYMAVRSDTEVFVRVGRGTYGLAGWGLDKAESYPNIVADILFGGGEPMSFGGIYQAVENTRAVRKGSLQMLLDLHPRFYRSEEGTYGLRCWLPPREKQTLRTRSAYVEPLSSFARVERAVKRGSDVERIVGEDRSRTERSEKLDTE